MVILLGVRRQESGVRLYSHNTRTVVEINQVVSYFNYANRTVVGLGVNTDDDIIGLSPNDSSDPTSWNHQ